MDTGLHEKQSCRPEILSEQMKKTLFTLNVNDYDKRITDLTYPLMETYADKIGADFQIIADRRFPDYPLVYEKLQIHELGKYNDWNYFIDSDALVHPDFFDPVEHISKEVVMHNGNDMASNRWKYDRFFRRDGRHIGSCTWFCIASNWCHELWKPLDDISMKEAISNIRPLLNELKTVKSRASLIDDYTMSRNIAKYGLKFKSVLGLLRDLGDANSDYLWHAYTVVNLEKVRQMKQILERWGLKRAPAVSIGSLEHVEGWMRFDELSWLATQALEHKCIVEIGSYLGRSTLALADHSLGEVYAVDDWKGPRDVTISEVDRSSLYDRFLSNIAGHSNIIPTKMDCENLNKLNVRPDMIFVDGDHSYRSVKRDVAWARSVASDDTLICGHDFERPEVRRAISEALEPDYQILSGVGLLWWAYRKPKSQPTSPIDILIEDCLVER